MHLFGRYGTVSFCCLCMCIKCFVAKIVRGFFFIVHFFFMCSTFVWNTYLYVYRRRWLFNVQCSCHFNISTKAYYTFQKGAARQKHFLINGKKTLWRQRQCPIRHAHCLRSPFFNHLNDNFKTFYTNGIYGLNRTKP